MNVLKVISTKIKKGYPQQNKKEGRPESALYEN
jgi:hypothetical protein